MNLLANEASPYLKQHANNPVNWYPYSSKAFALAKQQDKLIFLSIGYSSCHWCHVMARESFEDKETATFMNEHFISIKMDREERPGIDKIYQDLYQLLHGRGGGWPLSVWMNADAQPIYIGTYFPPVAKYGMPAFMDVNQQLVELWKFQRTEVEQQAAAIANGIALSNNRILENTPVAVSEQLFDAAIATLQQGFDTKYGGIGGAPKFPRISSLRFLLQEAYYRKRNDLLAFVQLTFEKMRQGGIYDQLGGGFARYSVDNKWLIPHFEKMLYDNAGMLRIGAELYALTQDSAVKATLQQTYEWLMRELRNDGGAFYASLNAESDGREGKYYVWDYTELQEILSASEFDAAVAYYGITREGNFQDPHHPEILGMNILSIVSNSSPSNLSAIQDKLFTYRDKRVHPDLDTKIITSWNAMLISGLLAFARHCNASNAGKSAVQALQYLLDTHVTRDSVLRYSTSGDFRPIEGTLEDYAYLIEALLDAFEYTNTWSFVQSADSILKLLQRKFYADSVYYELSVDSDELKLGRLIKITDDSFSAGIAIQLRNLYRLGHYMKNPEYITIGEQLISKLAESAQQYPTAMCEFLMATNYYYRHPDELVLVGSGELTDVLLTPYYPAHLVYRWPSTDERPKWEVLENRLSESKQTLFICKGQTCRMPITTRSMYDSVVNNELVFE